MRGCGARSGGSLRIGAPVILIGISGAQPHAKVVCSCPGEPGVIAVCLRYAVERRATWISDPRVHRRLAVYVKTGGFKRFPIVNAVNADVIDGD